jgi:hypothetical protein
MGTLLVTFREGLYPFNFAISKRGIYIFLRIGDHNFRLSTYGRLRLTHEVKPFPWYSLNRNPYEKNPKDSSKWYQLTPTQQSQK